VVVVVKAEEVVADAVAAAAETVGLADMSAVSVHHAKQEQLVRPGLAAEAPRAVIVVHVGGLAVSRVKSVGRNSMPAAARIVRTVSVGLVARAIRRVRAAVVRTARVGVRIRTGIRAEVASRRTAVTRIAGVTTGTVSKVYVPKQRTRPYRRSRSVKKSADSLSGSLAVDHGVALWASDLTRSS
jgi:hypothetical protein